MTKNTWEMFAICLVLSYRNHLNTKLVLYSNGRFVSGCQMVRLSLYIIPDTHTVHYSDESGIQLINIHMITVPIKKQQKLFSPWYLVF